MRAVMIRIPVVATLLIGSAALVPSPSVADTVTTCGQTISGSSVLANDLDCTGNVVPAITMENGAYLELQGHNVKGGTIGINCTQNCKIRGPGIVSDALIGINAYGKLRLIGATVSGNTNVGVQCYKTCDVSGGSISNNDGNGLTSVGTLKLSTVTIADNVGDGVVAGKSPGLGGVVKVDGGSITGNRNGIVSDRLVKIEHALVRDNLENGVRAGETDCSKGGQVVLKDTAIVRDNAASPDCGTTVECADINSCKKPNVKESTCLTSHVANSGIPGSDWDACTND
jgi:hypothetical protein